MNKKRLIKVDTPFGETKEEEVKEGMGQGGLDSTILSAASISNGVEDFFGEMKRKSSMRISAFFKPHIRMIL